MKNTILFLLTAVVASAESPMERMFDTQLNVSQRADACFALRGNAEKPVREAMLRALKLESLRACAATNLRMAGAVDELKTTLSDEAPEVRAVGARELGSFQRRDLLEPISKAASDPNLLVATNGIEGLTRYTTPDVYPYLEAIAKKGGIVGILALDRLEALKDPAAVVIARQLLKNPEVPDRVAALRVIGGAGDASDLPALRAIAAQKEEFQVRQRGFGLMPPINLSLAAKGAIAEIEKRVPAGGE